MDIVLSSTSRVYMYSSFFSVENVSHKMQLKGEGRGQQSQNVGELFILLQGMNVNMENYPPKNGKYSAFTLLRATAKVALKLVVALLFFFPPYITRKRCLLSDDILPSGIPECYCFSHPYSKPSK